MIPARVARERNTKSAAEFKEGYMIQKELLNEVTERLVSTYHPLEIYLFGSHAWGHPTQESDLDLLIVVENSQEKSYKRAMAGHLALHGMMLSKDILVLTKDEFNRLAEDITTLMHRVKKEGKKIYARA